MKRYAKALVAFVLALAMVSETWGGLSFVSKAENGAEVNAVAEDGKIGTKFPSVPSGETWSEYYASYDFSATDYYIENQTDFINFGRATRAGNDFAGKAIHLAQGFTYTSSAFSGIGTLSSPAVSFNGTFDGHGNTITGLKIGSSGIFANVNGATIKNLVIDGATMTTTAENRGLLVSKAYGNFVIDNVTVTDSTMNCNGNSAEKTEALENFGFIVAVAYGKATISGTTVTGCTMNLGSTTWASNIGAFVGSAQKGATITECTVKDTTITGSFAQANEENPNQDENSTLLPGVNPDNAKISENIGGVVGYVAGKFTAEDVVADNADISMANVLKNVGGFVGYITYAADGEEASTFENCSVKNANIKSTQYIWDAGYKAVDGEYVELQTEEKHYYHNIAGFAACVDKKATFTKCTVDNTVTQTQTRYRCGGGLIGSTFSYKTNAEGLPSKGIIEVSQCAVTHTTIKTGNSRNCNVVGGLIALLSEGSTVTDCYVYDYASPANNNSLYVGGLIGDIYDIQNGSGAEGKTVVKNCFVGNVTLQGYNYVGPMIGDADKGVDLAGLSNLLHCKLEQKEGLNQDQIKELEKHVLINRNKRSGQTPSTTTFEQVKEVAHESFTDRSLAFLLNCGGSDGNASSDVWMQGEEYPVFADGTQKPIRKVVFQAAGESFAYFTNAEGKLDAYPLPDDGYKWNGYELDTIKDVVFTENTWIYQILVNEELKVSNYEDYKDTETDFYIDSLEELQAFRTLVNTKHYTFEDKTIHLLTDIDMSSISDWGGIGTTTYPFGGTFDGHGHTISNLKAKGAGFFQAIGSVDGTIAQPTVKNFTLINAKVGYDAANDVAYSAGYGKAIAVSRIVGNTKNTSTNSQVLNVHVTGSTLTSNSSGCGVIVGCSQSDSTTATSAVTISGCTATDCTITSTATAGTGAGYWGIIMGRDISDGYSRIVGCTATDCHIVAEADNMDNTGVILGNAQGPVEVEECTVDGCTLAVAPNTGDTVQNIGGVVGRIQGSEPRIVDCTVTGTTITLEGKTPYSCALAVGHTNGGEISGIRVEGSTLNLNYNATNDQGGRIGIVAGGVGLTATADTLPSIQIEECVTEGNTINIAGRAFAIGGLVGRVCAYTDKATIKDSSVKNTKMNHTYTTEETSVVYSEGGAIGHAQKDVNVANVTVEGIQINTKGHANHIGGFIGYVESGEGSTFKNCKVTSYTGTDGKEVRSSFYQAATVIDSGDDYTHHISGFAGLVLTASTFELCSVKAFDSSTNVRTNAFGGIVASVYETSKESSTSKPSEFGIVNINRCSVIDVSVESRGGWQDHRIGGIVGSIGEGSTVTNCLVSEFSRETRRTDNAGILIGRIYNSDTTGDSLCTVKNCYLQNSTIFTTDNVDSVHIDFGQCVGSRKVEHVKYYNCNAYINTSTVVGARESGTTVVSDAADLTDKDLAYALNTTNGTESHNGSWAQGTTNPIIADEEHFPVAYVTYLRRNNDTGYGGMEYLIFPINSDGTIDYANGTRKFIRQTIITNENQVNRQELSADVAEQEPIDLSDNHYKESWEEEACSYTSEPVPNSGRVWQYPEGEIRTDVTITQIEKTAWDFNGDTQLSVSDLVRLKKSEEVNYNGNVCKASIIGTMLTTKVYDMTSANSSYGENQDLDSEGYLPSYRLRRVILTPPSNEVSVLSYNMYYDTYANIDDATRQSAIMELLGLKRGANDQVAGSYADYTDPKADIIALQEISADYWHDAIYKNYLAPYQYGTDGNGNGKIDPGELDTTQGSGGKKYYTYEHFGRGRYGHVFYNTEGRAFAGDSYTLIIYNQYKYRYKDGDSGTIYLSTTPTVASQGWDDTEADSVLDSQRAANWALFTDRATGEKFMFVNVHLSHNETGVNRQAVRMKQIELILRRVKEILGQGSREFGLREASGGIPIIIAGDFNAYLGTDAYSYALEQGYEDARETAVVSSEKHGAFNNWTTIDETKYAYGDHFLVNDRAEVQTYEVIDGDESDMDYNLINGYHMSDHCPIRATIDIGSDYIASTTSEKTGIKYNEILGFK